MRILRHELEITDYQTITLPAAGDVLSVANSRTDENYKVDLWTLDTEHGPERTVGVYIFGTGNPIPEEQLNYPEVGAFVGTVVAPNGLVWHVFQGTAQ